MTHDQGLAIFVAIFISGSWNVLLAVVISNKLSKVIKLLQQK